MHFQLSGPDCIPYIAMRYVVCILYRVASSADVATRGRPGSGAHARRRRRRRWLRSGTNTVCRLSFLVHHVYYVLNITSILPLTFAPKVKVQTI